MITVQTLRDVQISHKASLDAVYAERNLVLAMAAKLAVSHPMAYAYRSVDDSLTEDDPWRWIITLVLSGHFDGAPKQLTWHINERELPLFEHLRELPNAWDGHTTAEKYERIRAWVSK